MVLATAPPHLMHFLRGGSVTFWMTSNTELHFEHLYSYNGILISLLKTPYYTRVPTDIKDLDASMLVKDDGFECVDLRPGFPGIFRQACFSTGLLEERQSRPSVFDRDLGQ